MPVTDLNVTTFFTDYADLSHKHERFGRKPCDISKLARFMDRLICLQLSPDMEHLWYFFFEEILMVNLGSKQKKILVELYADVCLCIPWTMQEHSSSLRAFAGSQLCLWSG